MKSNRSPLPNSFHKADLAAVCARVIACLPAVWLALAGPRSFSQAVDFTVSSIPNGLINADTIVEDQGAPRLIYYDGTIGVDVNSFNGITYSPPNNVLTFCIELNQDISFDHYTSFVAENLGSESRLTPQAVKDMTSLYYLFYQGNSYSDWTDTTAAAFQLDLWKISEDPGSYSLAASSTNNFYVTNTGPEVSLAQSWLTAVSGTTVSASPFVIEEAEPYAFYDPNYQDLLFTQEVYNDIAPFHVQAWPAALLLGGIVFFRVQNRVRAQVKAAA